jgi:RNase H-like domain found in reverse transcriptase
MGACLLQIDRQGRLRPVAYFSKKLSPAECNYEIHDKELLAIVRAMEEWRGELTGLVNRFTVLSDHKNLQHFMTARKLTERQVRWSQVLSQFNFQLRFRAGKKSLRPDALSRRQQDMPRGEEDERLRNRISQLLKDEWLPPNTIKHHQSQFVQEHLINAVQISPAATTHVKPPRGALIFQEPDLQLLWDRGVVEDTDFSRMYKSLSKGERSFPPDISHRLKVSISECSFDERGVLQFRNKTWIPD